MVHQLFVSDKANKKKQCHQVLAVLGDFLWGDFWQVLYIPATHDLPPTCCTLRHNLIKTYSSPMAHNSKWKWSRGFTPLPTCPMSSAAVDCTLHLMIIYILTWENLSLHECAADMRCTVWSVLLHALALWPGGGTRVSFILCSWHWFGGWSCESKNIAGYTSTCVDAMCSSAADSCDGEESSALPVIVVFCFVCFFHPDSWEVLKVTSSVVLLTKDTAPLS